MSEPIKKVSASKYPASTREKPVGVPIPVRPGASTQARCKTCGKKPPSAP
jgi:hypothetical protein